MTTSAQTLEETPDEKFRMLFHRTAKLNDAVSALLNPKWGAEAGLIPEDHPLHPGAREESEESGAPTDWRAVAQDMERRLKAEAVRRHEAEAEVKQWEATYGENALRDALARLNGAEAAVERVRALRDRWVKAGPPPLGASMARWRDARLIELNTALAEPKKPCGADSQAPNALGNERCTLPAGHDGRHADGTLTWPRAADEPKEH